MHDNAIIKAPIIYADSSEQSNEQVGYTIYWTVFTFFCRSPKHWIQQNPTLAGLCVKPEYRTLITGLTFTKMVYCEQKTLNFVKYFHFCAKICNKHLSIQILFYLLCFYMNSMVMII